MKTQKLKLDDSDNEQVIEVALVKLKKQMADYEFFYQINKLGSICFNKAKDLFVKGEYFDYYFSVFQAINLETNTKFLFLKNKSDYSIQKKEILELFIDEQNVKLLLKNEEIDYIFYSSEEIPDFSVISPTEKINTIFSFSFQKLDDELIHTIFYYE